MKTRLIIAAAASMFAASLAVSAPTFANFISGADSQSDRRNTVQAFSETTLVVEEVRFRGAAAPTTTASAASCLESATSLATSLLAPHDIPVPGFTHDPSASHRAYYTVGGGITIRECVSDSIIAHELGHYIHFLSVGSNWSAMKTDSLNFCLGQDPSTGRCEGGWLSDNGKKSEASAAPGVEHAAHCIGNQLGVSGSYSKCPDAALISAAQARIASA